MKKRREASALFWAIILGAIAGAVAALFVVNISEPSHETLVKEWYAAETAVHVSPHHIRKHMAQGDTSFILIDLRSEEEYNREHIAGAINIPAYKDPDTSAYGDVERIVNAFNKLPKNKDLIVYCYSIPCMTGRKIGNMLAEHDIYVKHLGVGWNEWKYDWTGWNHEHEWNQTNTSDYLASGPAPGQVKGANLSTGCPVEGAFGC